MDRIEKHKIYLSYLEEINEGKGKSREKKIADAVQKIKKFLVNEEVINFLINAVVDRESSKGVKYLVWMANLVKNVMIDEFKNRDLKQLHFKNFLETGEIDDNWSKRDFDITDSLKKMDDRGYHFGTISIGVKVGWIMDWLKSPLRENEEIDLTQYKTLDEAFEEAKAWHDELDATGHIEEEHGKVIKTFDDGWYWIDLETTEDKDEGEAMGHCGRTTEGTTLLSLRKNKSPHVTMAISEEEVNLYHDYNGCITQCKGRNNKKPIKKYHQYIVDLLIDKNFKADNFFLEYDTGDDFNVNDLNDELYKKLLTSNINWLQPNSVEKFYNIFKDDYETIKKIKNCLFLFELCKIDNKLIEITKDVFTDEFLNQSKLNFGTTIKLRNNNLIIKQPIKISGYYHFLKFDVKNAHQNQMPTYIEEYKILLSKFYNLSDMFNYAKRNANFYVFMDTINKCKKTLGLKVIPTLHDFAKEYIEHSTHKFEEIQKSIVKFIKDNYNIDVNFDEKGYVTSIVNFKDFLKDSNPYKPNSIYKFIDGWNHTKATEFKKGISYVCDYDFLTELNDYVLKKSNVTESLITEKLGVADDIEEWYDLLYYIFTVQVEGFVDSVKNDPETFQKILEIDEEEMDVYTADVGIPETDINELIDEKISKKNKLKLKNLSIEFSMTILPEEHFTNYLFSSDAYYDDSQSKFDGESLSNCEIFIQIYLPDSVFDENIKSVLNDYEINLKLRQSLSHELDHAYEFFNKIKTGNIDLPESKINQIRKMVSDSPFSKLSEDFQKFLYLVYIGLSFEGSARVTQLFYQLKEYKIDNESYFWSIVKDSIAWKDLEMLKDFNPTEFYKNIKFEMSDEDIKDVFIETKIYTEKDFEKNDIKDLVIKHWLKVFDKMIEEINKEGKSKVPRINKQMFDHPVLFFKYYDKKFKKSWKYFYNRIIKMSVIYVSITKNHL